MAEYIAKGDHRFHTLVGIQTPEIAITFYYRIVDGHTEFAHCMLLFDKSNKRSTQLETAVI